MLFRSNHHRQHWHRHHQLLLPDLPSVTSKPNCMTPNHSRSQPRFRPLANFPSIMATSFVAYPPTKSSPLANQHHPRISHTSLGSSGPSGVDLPNSQLEHSGTRLGSRRRPEIREAAVMDGNGMHTPPPRPSILRGHHHSHSPSSNQSEIQDTSFCALRFEPSSSIPYQPMRRTELSAF